MSDAGVIQQKTLCSCIRASDGIQVLNKHEEELLFVLGGAPLETYRMGTWLDVCVP